MNRMSIGLATSLLLTGSHLSFFAQGDGKAKIQEIALSTVYSMSKQDGLRYIPKEYDGEGAERKVITKIEDLLVERKSSPTAFFLRADTFGQAVLATERGLSGKDLPKKPIAPDGKTTSDRIWLFVYLKHDGSEPPQWIVLPPRIYYGEVRFEYRAIDLWPDQTGVVTADSRAYLYWVPMGVQKDADQFAVEIVEWKKAPAVRFPR
jgi:hypothetical protein